MRVSIRLGIIRCVVLEIGRSKHGGNDLKTRLYREITGHKRLTDAPPTWRFLGGFMSCKPLTIMRGYFWSGLSRIRLIQIRLGNSVKCPTNHFAGIAGDQVAEIACKTNRSKRSVERAIQDFVKNFTVCSNRRPPDADRFLGRN
jgi:hypothetical protein